MAGFSLRRYDTQARFGLYVAIASVFGLMALVSLVFSIDKGFANLKGLVIYYGPARRLAILAAGGVATLLGATAFGFGLNGAGQRRNDKPLLSWISFFIGGIVVCLSLVLLFFFNQQGEPATIQ